MRDFNGSWEFCNLLIFVHWETLILGDQGAVSGGGKKSKRARKKFGRRKVKNDEQPLGLRGWEVLDPSFLHARCFGFLRSTLCRVKRNGNYKKSGVVWLCTEKNNGFPFLDILGYLKNTHKNPTFGRVRQSQLGNLVGNSLIGICLTLPNLGFLWVFFKYPKISKNGNPLFFPVVLYHIFRSHRSAWSAWFPMLTVRRFSEFNTSVICMPCLYFV